VEITRFTALPLLTLAAAAGLCVITRPLATVALDCEVTVLVRPAPVIAVVAAVCESPTTFGTLIWAAGPLDPSPHAVIAAAIRANTNPLTAFPLAFIMFKLLPLFRNTKVSRSLGQPRRRASDPPGFMAEWSQLGQFPGYEFLMNRE
jgi:hypothetical protein